MGRQSKEKSVFNVCLHGKTGSGTKKGNPGPQPQRGREKEAINQEGTLVEIKEGRREFCFNLRAEAPSGGINNDRFI